MHKSVAILLLTIALAYGQTFSADVAIYNSPGVVGVLNGKMYYKPSYIEIDYTFGPKEIIDYRTVPEGQVRYLGCGSPITCSAESYKLNQPLFYQLGSDTSANPSDPLNCGSGVYTRSGSNDKDVVKISFSGGNVCAAKLKDGTTYYFSNYVASVPSNAFSTAGWNCPAKQCDVQMDIMLVVDVSGSVSVYWPIEKEFAINITKAFKISETATKFGYVTFDSQSYIQYYLNNDATSVRNGIANSVLTAGNTCIGCGLRSAKLILNSYSRATAQPVIILITDGENNSGTGNNEFNTAITFAKSAVTANGKIPLIIAVGVVGADVAQLQKAASGSAGSYNFNGRQITTVYTTSSWNSLATLLSGIIDATCTDLGNNPCGGCNGFCSCGKTCVCPDCDTRDKCSVGTCSANIFGGGCVYKAPDCDDQNACTTDSCSSASGCAHTPYTCPPKPCFTVTCNTQAGCIYTPVQCNDGDDCTNDFCDAGTGTCATSPKACDRCKNAGLTAASCSQGKSKCEIWDCVQNTTDAWCAIVQRKDAAYCTDSNACTDDTCDTTTGNCVHTPKNCDDNNKCTDDSCDSSSGCKNIAYNVTSYCDDHTACTTDTCVPATGCVNTPIVCDDQNPCTDDTCNSLTGCQYPYKSCGDDPAFKGLVGDCYVAQCNDLKGRFAAFTPAGCFLEQQVGTKIDRCRVCNGNGNSCFLGIGVKAAAGIGAGVVAAIVIGSVAAVAIVGGIAGKKGYDAWKRNRNNLDGANNSAIYVDPKTSGSNPFYNHR